MIGVNGAEAVLLVVLLALPLLLFVVAVIWAVRVQQRVRRLEAHRPAGDSDVAALRADIAGAMRHVAVVRYDAFGDMGGRLSFSAALVDDAGNGLVISAIHARGESRTYAKGLVAASSDTTLTPEEQQALAAARTGRASA